MSEASLDGPARAIMHARQVAHDALAMASDRQTFPAELRTAMVELQETAERTMADLAAMLDRARDVRTTCQAFAAAALRFDSEQGAA